MREDEHDVRVKTSTGNLTKLTVGSVGLASRSPSLDGGVSWTGPVTLNDDTFAAPVSHTFQGVTWTGDSTLTAAWLDERAGGMTTHEHASRDSSAESDATIYAASSPDFGKRWEPNRPLWGAACPCCRVVLARGRDGSALAAWRRHFPQDIRDVVVGRVGDLSEPVRVHRDGWEFKGCPHSGPAVAVDDSGWARVAWYTGRAGRAGVYLVRATGATTFDSAPVALMRRQRLQPAHPAIAVLRDGSTIAAWDLDARGRRGLSLGVVGVGESRARTVAMPGTAGASYPQLAALRDGSAALAWTEMAGERFRLRVARVVVATSPRAPAASSAFAASPPPP